MALKKLIATNDGVCCLICDECSDLQPLTLREFSSQNAHKALEIPSLNYVALPVNLRKTVCAALECVLLFAFYGAERANLGSPN